MTASNEFKAKLVLFLAEQKEPLRLWDIANGVGYSGKYTRAALRLLTEEGIVECIARSNSPAFKERVRTSTGFDESFSQGCHRYRLRPERGEQDS